MNILKKYIKIILIIIIIIIIGSLILLKIYLEKDNKNIEIKKENIIEIDKKEEEINVEKKYVDIKGAIKKPGVYEIENNTRTIDIITKAGGLTEEADTTYTNLSQKLKDEMIIIIYTKEQIKKSKEKDTLSVKEVSNTCICPKIKNDTCINNEITAKTETVKDNKTETNNKININESTLEELLTITGIGESKAKAIIEYREKNGKFTKIEDIKNVSGIGEALYEKIKDSITV
ncbi:MAG: helix-hairpin-helix domain-containing protein [Bacilli bacterium]|nr:helix-hairpin-helix domain-containing protein [Bacilli bacterium]